MNGSVTPVSGTSRVIPPRMTIVCRREHGRQPGRKELGEAVVCPCRDREAARGKEQEDADDGDSPDEPELGPDRREDEVGLAAPG